MDAVHSPDCGTHDGSFADPVTFGESLGRVFGIRGETFAGKPEGEGEPDEVK